VELVGPHRERRGEDGEDPDGVDREAPAGAGRRDDDARERRAVDPGDAEQARVERDRIGELVAADELERQVLPRGHVENDCSAQTAAIASELPRPTPANVIAVSTAASAIWIDCVSIAIRRSSKGRRAQRRRARRS
jgi:hypothetical protein